MPLIELENIIKTYKNGRVRAVNNVSLSINKGDFTAIVGHSGSGKSTLMNIIGCLDTPDSGRYTLDGEEIFSLPSKRLAEIRNLKIGFIFQGFNLIPTLTAAENVELPLYYRGIKQKARKRASAQALEMVGLAERADHKPAELSGGQQQRVAIARRWRHRPP